MFTISMISIYDRQAQGAVASLWRTFRRVSTSLADQRPGSNNHTLQEYDRALGGILPDEPVAVFRISKDGEYRVLRQGEHNFDLKDYAGTKIDSVTVFESPEDDFWFFSVFRPALFDLQIRLPSFISEMGLVHAYALFEAYISNLLRMRLRQHPKLMGDQRELTYERVFAAASKDSLIESMIHREVQELLYLPLTKLITVLRSRFGFRSLITEYDDAASYVSLLRNCFVHNSGRADIKLVKIRPSLHLGEQVSVTLTHVQDAVKVLRKFAYELDKAFEHENLGLQSPVKD